MAYSFNGSTQYLSCTTAPVASPPLTLAGYQYSTASFPGDIVALGATTFSGFRITGEDAFGVMQVASVSGTYLKAVSTSGASVNTWFHGCGVIAATNSRTIYLNGGSSATNTSNINVTPTNLGIGAWNASGGPYGYVSGYLSEIAIWNASLTAAEVESLAKGFKPTRIRPQSLVFYAPLIRNLQDTKGALAITNNNSATVADHPRVY